jgi:hypothetical protein
MSDDLSMLLYAICYAMMMMLKCMKTQKIFMSSRASTLENRGDEELHTIVLNTEGKADDDL